MSCWLPWQDWRDPLSNIGPITENPAIHFGNYKPDPESVLLDAQEYVSLQKGVKNVLDSYKPLTLGDVTVPFLGIFLNRLPGGGRFALLCDIAAVGYDDEGLRRLARHLIDAILRPMLLAGGNQPYLKLRERNDSPLQQIADFHTNSLDCLVRDDFQCIVTGRYGTTLAPNGPFGGEKGILHGLVRPVHILPFALGYFNSRFSKLNWYKWRIWKALHRYFPALKGKIDGTCINQPANMTTMCLGVYELFGAGKVALWPLNTPNTYHFRQSRTDEYPKGMEANEVVGVREDTCFPLPNGEFFRTQCIISEIIQVSGLAPLILYGPRI